MRPNFLIVGAAKSGTTSLVQYLLQHPKIFIAREKENHFFLYQDTPPLFHGPGDAEGFSRLLITDQNRYKECFQEAGTASAIGDASVYYLYRPEALERAYARNPGMRFIVILREPRDRSWSAYRHMVRDGWETQSFERALDLESVRIADGWSFGWHYAAVSDYLWQVRKLLGAVPRSQVLFLQFEALVQAPIGVIHQVCDFLNLEKEFEFDVSVAFNQSGIPKSRRLNGFIVRDNLIRRAAKVVVPYRMGKRFSHKLLSLNLHKRDAVRPDAFHDQMPFADSEWQSELESLTGLDLSAW